MTHIQFKFEQRLCSKNAIRGSGYTNNKNININSLAILLNIAYHLCAKLTANIKLTFVISNNEQHKFCKKNNQHRFKSLRKKNADCN